LEFPDDLLYTVEDAWLRIEGDEGTVGITDFAQEQLGEVVYVELPEVGKDLTGGEPFGIIESVKAVSDLHLPLGGEVTARNDALLDTPELVNSSPYGDGWMLTIRLSDPAEADGLLSAANYRAGLPEE
jgi:glycine cleavage system H protein